MTYQLSTNYCFIYCYFHVVYCVSECAWLVARAQKTILLQCVQLLLSIVTFFWLRNQLHDVVSMCLVLVIGTMTHAPAAIAAQIAA